jgi:competence protein ComEA
MSESRRVSPWYLQPRDQRMIAAILCVAFIAVVGYWWIGSWRHGWIEIDSAERQTVEFQIDLNSAEWSEFSQLPGVGETLARRIVERRQQSGPYRNADELLKVQGVGKKTLERIKPFLVIKASTAN